MGIRREYRQLQVEYALERVRSLKASIANPWIDAPTAREYRVALEEAEEFLAFAKESLRRHDQARSLCGN